MAIPPFEDGRHESGTQPRLTGTTFLHALREPEGSKGATRSRASGAQRSPGIRVRLTHIFTTKRPTPKRLEMSHAVMIGRATLGKRTQMLGTVVTSRRLPQARNEGRHEHKQGRENRGDVGNCLVITYSLMYFPIGQGKNPRHPRSGAISDMLLACLLTYLLALKNLTASGATHKRAGRAQRSPDIRGC